MKQSRNKPPQRPPQTQRPAWRPSARVWWYAAGGLAVALVLAAAVTWLAVRAAALPVARVLAAYREGGRYASLEIRYPADGSLFPPEIIAPVFRWKDPQRGSTAWLVTVELSDGGRPRHFSSDAQHWTPPPRAWEQIKRHSVERPARVTILGFQRERPDEILSAASVSIRTSRDPVAAPIFYREVDLPFLTTVRNPARHIRWRFGTIDSPQPPPVVLEGMPVCANCHSFSRDGETFGMDVDYASDKGSYIVRPVAREMALEREQIITWSDYRREDKRPTFGLLSQVSPDGRYVISTVKDRSVFLPMPDLAFSQLFFPVQGILGVYDRQADRFFALPGADDPRYVQSNAVWSPDGQTIVFARAEAAALPRLTDQRKVLLAKEDVPEFLQEGGEFLFELYRIPFHGGRGGRAEPLAGASRNGRSNYFARYSPDGKWIVFCQARSFMLLQPDSQLYIIPAAGGEPRRLQGNTARMNSWHSWSPNSRWLVFSSKANSPYTQFFLTHIDQAGNSSPPVLLEQFTAADKAGNIPEFVNTRPAAIARMHERFLDEHSYIDTGGRHIFYEDYALASEAYQQALAINPRSQAAYVGWGIALLHQREFVEARDKLLIALEINPDNPMAHSYLAQVLTRLGDFPGALRHQREVVRLTPEDADAQAALGSLLVDAGDFAAGRKHLAEAARLAPESPVAQVVLGVAQLREGLLEQAEACFQRALQIDPQCVPALLQLASLRATSQRPSLRNPEDAIALASQACELTDHQDPGPLLVLAVVYHEASRTADAVQVGQAALRVAQATGRADVAETIRKRLSEWQQP